MQTGTPNREASSPTNVGAPPLIVETASDPAAPRDEDSGLHDIRNLAQSTKQRISKRMGTAPPPMSDNDVLSSSSASWKNLALPQPARMVSLPDLDTLPSKQELAAAEKAAKLAAKEAARQSKQDLKAAAVAPVSTAAVEASTSASTSSAVDYKPAFSAFAPKAKSNKTRTYALIGMGLAAAAGITLFVTTQNNHDAATPVATTQGVAPKTADLSLSKDKLDKLDEATAKLEAEHAAALAAAEAPAPAPADTNAVGGAAVPAIDKAPTKPVATKSHGAATGKGQRADVVTTTTVPEITKTEPKKPAAGGEQDPSFDALLKEAGVKEKKAAAPKLDKKELSGDEFKKGMAAITSKAQACFKGTQGSANVKLTIAPSGQVSKVTINGQFAGKPEADCVSAAVKSATFPAWDGGPQSFGYPILLSE